MQSVNLKYEPCPYAVWDVSKSSDEILIKTYSAIDVHFDYLGLHYDIKIPMNFVSNYGTIPMIFRNIIPNCGNVDMGYLVHDWLYDTDFLKYNPQYVNLDKNDADIILRNILIDRGMNIIKANIVYQAVRFFAGSHYRQGPTMVQAA